MRQTTIIEPQDKIMVEKSVVEVLQGLWIHLDGVSIQGSDEKMADLAIKILEQLPYDKFEEVFHFIDNQRHDQTYRYWEERSIKAEAEIDRLKGDMF